MEETLDKNGVSVTFTEVTDDRVYVAYRTNNSDVQSLATELQLVVEVILEEHPDTAIRGGIFYTQHPVIALWDVETALAERWERDDLPGRALLLEVLHTLQTVRF